MKKILVLLFISTVAFAQKNVNHYEYIIVPEKMAAFKKPDMYQTSSLIKFLFHKNGFKAFLNNEALPEDLAFNRCNALTADMEDDSGMFSTKVTLVLKDCYNQVVFKAQEGKSKLKNYKKAYHEAIRKSFNSIKQLNYKFIKSITQTSMSNKLATVEKKYDLEQKEVKKKGTARKKHDMMITLYAQSIDNGFQLVDNVPKIVFKILKTQTPDLYIIKDKDGILIEKENGFWVAEYYVNGKLITKNYTIKF